MEQYFCLLCFLGDEAYLISTDQCTDVAAPMSHGNQLVSQKQEGKDEGRLFVITYYPIHNNSFYQRCATVDK